MDFPPKYDEIYADNVEIEDEVLVQAAKKNRAAFGPIYRRYVNKVYRYIYRRVGNYYETEDLTAQVFEDAIKALPSYRPQGMFASWLFGFAYRRCVDFYRRPKIEGITDKYSSELLEDPVEQVINQETSQRLQKLLAGLNDKELELLRMHFAAQLTYQEMGEILQRNEGAIKMAMSRLIQKLKLRWEVENE
jgi:RNA polymerase sigma-70 factor (ECF subfamily)